MPGRIEPSVTPVAAKITSRGHHVVAGVDAVEVGDPGLLRAALFIVVAKDEATEHLPAHAFQRGCGQNALGRATRAHVHVDAGRAARRSGSRRPRRRR